MTNPRDRPRHKFDMESTNLNANCDDYAFLRPTRRSEVWKGFWLDARARSDIDESSYRSLGYSDAQQPVVSLGSRDMKKHPSVFGERNEGQNGVAVCTPSLYWFNWGTLPVVVTR